MSPTGQLRHLTFQTGENLKSSPKFQSSTVGVRTRGTLGDIDPLNKVPFKRARSRVKKGPLLI